MDSEAGRATPWMVTITIPGKPDTIELPRFAVRSEVDGFLAALGEREPTWTVTARRLEPEEALVLGLYHQRK